MTVIKVVNSFNIVAGIFGALLNAKFAADYFSERHVGCGILCLAFAAGCLLCALFSKRIIELVDSFEEDCDEGEAK